MSIKPMEAPKCRLCEKNHWAREGCYGMHTTAKNNRESGQRVVQQGPTKATGRTVSSEPTNTSREGRRVLKGSTGASHPAKPTRTASTEKADPPAPAKAPANMTTAAKVTPGKGKPRSVKKKGANK